MDIMHQFDCSSGHDYVLLATSMSKAIVRHAVHTHALATRVYLLVCSIDCLEVITITDYYSLIDTSIYHLLCSIYVDYFLLAMLTYYSLFFAIHDLLSRNLRHLKTLWIMIIQSNVCKLATIFGLAPLLIQTVNAVKIQTSIRTKLFYHKINTIVCLRGTL